jgi:hypothetical protein
MRICRRAGFRLKDSRRLDCESTRYDIQKTNRGFVINGSGDNWAFDIPGDLFAIFFGRLAQKIRRKPEISCFTGITQPGHDL